jgi:hypothetical protein
MEVLERHQLIVQHKKCGVEIELKMRAKLVTEKMEHENIDVVVLVNKIVQLQFQILVKR